MCDGGEEAGAHLNVLFLYLYDPSYVSAYDHELVVDRLALYLQKASRLLRLEYLVTALGLVRHQIAP